MGFNQGHLNETYEDAKEAADVYQRIESYLEETGNSVEKEEVSDFGLENYIERFGPITLPELDDITTGDKTDVNRELKMSPRIEHFDLIPTSRNNSDHLGVRNSKTVLHSVDERPEVVINYVLEANDIELSKEQTGKGSSWAAHYALVESSSFYENNPKKAGNVLKYRDSEGWQHTTNREKQLDDTFAWKDGEWERVP